MMIRMTPKNLMFRDADGGAGGSGSGEAGKTDDGKTGSEGGTGTESSEDKRFTQEQLNSILATEKKKNISATYKELGFESAEDAKKFIEKYREEEEKNKTALEKAQDELTAMTEQKAAEAKKVAILEHRIAVMSAGCTAENADDVVTLAMNRMTDDKDFDTALEEVKKQHPAMFGSSAGSEGTGSGGTTPRKMGKDDVNGIGKTLAEAEKKPSSNEYFKN